MIPKLLQSYFLTSGALIPSNPSYLMFCTYPPTFTTYSPLHTKQWSPPTTPFQSFASRSSAPFTPPSLFLLLPPPLLLLPHFFSPFPFDTIWLCFSLYPLIYPFPSPPLLSSPQPAQFLLPTYHLWIFYFTSRLPTYFTRGRFHDLSKFVPLNVCHFPHFHPLPSPHNLYHSPPILLLHLWSLPPLTSIIFGLRSERVLSSTVLILSTIIPLSLLLTKNPSNSCHVPLACLNHVNLFACPTKLFTSTSPCSPHKSNKSLPASHPLPNPYIPLTPALLWFAPTLLHPPPLSFLHPLLQRSPPQHHRRLLRAYYCHPLFIFS